MTAANQPCWWKPGMPDAEIAMWEAAERCAMAAPEITPGSDVALKLKALFPDFPQWLREHRASQKPETPAA